MIKHVIFDFDGTIVDSMDLTFRIANELADKYDLKRLDREEYKLLSSLPIKDRFKKIGISLFKVPSFLVEFLKSYSKYSTEIELIPGLGELITELDRKGLKTSIISSNSVENIEKFLESKKLSVNKVYSSNGLFSKHKTIKKFMKDFDAEIDEIIYIGDELRDINSCKAVGAKIVSVTWGYDPRELLLKGEPDYIADSPSDILNIIAECQDAIS